MKSRWKLAIIVLGISLLAVSNLTAVGAQGPPDMTKFDHGGGAIRRDQGRHLRCPRYLRSPDGRPEHMEG